MTPQRSATVNGHKVEEFYWNGRMVVYVDNAKTVESYSQALSRVGGYIETRTA